MNPATSRRFRDEPRERSEIVINGSHPHARQPALDASRKRRHPSGEIARRSGSIETLGDELGERPDTSRIRDARTEKNRIKHDHVFDLFLTF
jgi:hypothetical protein